MQPMPPSFRYLTLAALLLVPLFTGCDDTSTSSNGGWDIGEEVENGTPTGDCTFLGAIASSSGSAEGSVGLLGGALAGSQDLTITATTSLAGVPRTLDVDGCRIHAALDGDGYALIEVNQDRQPVHRATYDDVSRVVHAHGSGDLVALAAFHDGAILLDASSPEGELDVLASIPTPTPADYVAIHGDRLYIVDNVVMIILFVYDISDPTNPVELDEFAYGGSKPTGFVIDHQREDIYLALTDCFMGEDDVNCNRSLDAFDISGGGLEYQAHYSASGSGQIGPLALGPQGTLVVWDSQSGLMLLESQGDTLEMVGQPTSVEWTARSMSSQRDQILAVTESGELKSLQIDGEANTPISIHPANVDGLEADWQSVALRPEE